MTQLSPMNSWKSMGPLVVSAWKLGAMVPRRRLHKSKQLVAWHDEARWGAGEREHTVRYAQQPLGRCLGILT